jgi:flavin reductase (DIM6/NTAB) family NADH-FMN oxidoreductase RutF
MTSYSKRSFPVQKIRRFLEPGPIVLVSSQWKGEIDVMAMGWHTMLEFEPALFGCLISEGNHSFNLIRQSKECVINLPTIDLANKVVSIGNCHGGDIDKFSRFNLTPQRGLKVKAPLIRECYANFECKLHDARMITKYNFFIWKVVRALVARSPKYPRTIHYTGDGVFMLSGRHRSFADKFRPENL